MPSLDRLPTILRRTAGLAALTLLLAACGGGGSADAGNTNTYDLDSAISRLLLNGPPAASLTASFSGVQFSLSQSYVRLADASFEGALRQALRETTTIIGGSENQTVVSTMYFSTNPFVDHGSVEQDGARSVLTPTGNLPSFARVGDSGPLNTGTSYTDASKQVITATVTNTWSLDADTATTALACLRSVIRQVGAATPITGAQCWRIDTAGNVLGSQVTIGFNGNTLQFR